jgi:hypothetical protein
MERQDYKIPGFSLSLNLTAARLRCLSRIFSSKRYILQMQVEIREKGPVQVHIFRSSHPGSALVHSPLIFCPPIVCSYPILDSD